MEEKLIAIIAEIKENPALSSKLTPESSINIEAGLTSLEMVSFIFKVEEEFDVEVDFDSFDYSALQSISKFCAYLSALKKNTSSAA